MRAIRNKAEALPIQLNRKHLEVMKIAAKRNAPVPTGTAQPHGCQANALSQYLRRFSGLFNVALDRFLAG
jgi:hypothetical protein